LHASGIMAVCFEVYSTLRVISVYCTLHNKCIIIIPLAITRKKETKMFFVLRKKKYMKRKSKVKWLLMKVSAQFHINQLALLMLLDCVWNRDLFQEE